MVHYKAHRGKVEPDKYGKTMAVIISDFKMLNV